MAWQAVNRMHYSQAGGGGPRGGGAAGLGRPGPGSRSWAGWPSGWGPPQPSGTPAQFAAVRHALAAWGVTTVVIATDPAAPPLQQGRDPTYAAAFMTAALGRPPTVQAGAWVWNHVQLGLHPAARIGAGALATCVRAAEGPSGRVVAGQKVADCVLRGEEKRP